MPISPTTHETLLVRLAAGQDHAAWKDFCDRYGELIRRFALQQGLQPADCDDVLQEALLALARTMPRFQYDSSKGRFRSYLKRLVLHAIYRYRIRQKRGAGAPLDIEGALAAAEGDAAVEDAWETEWRQYHLRQAMRAIEVEFNQTDRAAFGRYVVQRQDAQQTAQELDLSIDQVYKAKSRILKRLAELVEQQVQEEG